jgi:hypothetical protein
LRHLYYDKFIKTGEGMSMPLGVYNLDKIKKWGKSRNWCPHYIPDLQGHQPPGSTIVGHDDDDGDGLQWGCKWK